MPDTERPKLPGLTASDTAWLVAEAGRVLADLGHRPDVIDGVALATEDGRTVGLDNLARTISRLPPKRWATAVRDQLTTLEAAGHGCTPVDADLRVKLWSEQQAKEMLEYRALEPLPGLMAVLAAAGDGFSMEFEKLDVLGDRDEAYDTALRNMTALPRPCHVRRRVDPGVRSSWVDFLDSPDAYGAARVAVLPDLLRKLRIDLPSHGVLVCVPTKFELWVHVPTDEYVLDTAVAMSWLALRSFTERPYPISPDVFLVSPDMQAARAVRPDARGFDLDDRVLRDLLDAMGIDLDGAA